MGTTTDEIVKRDARTCSCGQAPSWSKLRGGDVIIACMNTKCQRFPAVKGPCVYDAIQNWNEEVGKYDPIRKRR
jgi:hypothetical protein